MNTTRRVRILVTDDRGRPIRATRVAPWVIFASRRWRPLAALALSVVIGGGLVLTHRASAALRLSRHNAALAEDITRLQAAAPRLSELHQKNRFALARLWERSGLDYGQGALAQGPIEAPPSLAERPWEGGPPAPSSATDIESRSRKAHRELEELLEYFHDAERLLRRTPSINPAGRSGVTSEYGRRSDPITGQSLMHKGLDLGAASGAPVHAPADGTVIFVGRRGSYGQTVVLDHGYGLQTHFAHLSDYEVKMGQGVARGQRIASVGSTGKSTGPHLHYEVRRMGHPLNPAAFILD